MSLDTIVSVSITKNGKNPTREGFGIPLLAVMKVPGAWGVTKVRSFSSPKDMTDLGFLVTDPAYLMALKIWAQNPAPKTIKIGKRTAGVRTIKLQVTNHTEAYVYDFYVNGNHVTYTVLAGATNDTVATALAALIDAFTVVAATASTDTITITAASGTIFDVTGWRGAARDSGLLLSDASTDPGIGTDLAAFKAADADWYGLALDAAGKIEHAAAALWTEANGIIYVGDTADSECLDGGDTDDCMSAAKALSYARTGFIISTEALMHYGACAWLGSRLPAAPGSDTWKFKTLVGVLPSNMTESEKTAIHNKNGNTYTTIAGISMTEEGTTASGEFFDVTRFIDWLTSEIQINVFAALANAEKIPFTDAGVDVIKGITLNRLNAGVKVGGLAKDPAPTVDAPLVADVSDSDKRSRTLPDVTFSGVLAGAIHKLVLTGTISV